MGIGSLGALGRLGGRQTRWAWRGTTAAWAGGSLWSNSIKTLPRPGAPRFSKALRRVPGGSCVCRSAAFRARPRRPGGGLEAGKRTGLWSWSQAPRLLFPSRRRCLCSSNPFVPCCLMASVSGTSGPPGGRAGGRAGLGLRKGEAPWAPSILPSIPSSTHPFVHSFPSHPGLSFTRPSPGSPGRPPARGSSTPTPLSARPFRNQHLAGRFEARFGF